MMIVKLIDFLLARRKAVGWVALLFLAALVLVDALFVDKHHAHTEVETFPAFWALYGFLGCALIVGISKLVAKAGLIKEEEYYND